MYQQTNPIYQNSKAVRDMVLLLMDTCIFLSMIKGSLAVRVNHSRKATTPLYYTGRKSL
jgi:hypothetical protein